MELRDIEIFLTLAEELHFSRTAERLHVSQARVSQAIKAQERRIGAPLFDRTSRRVRLTPVGEQLRDDLRTAYDAIQAGLSRAADSVRGVTGTIRVGVMGALGHELRGTIDLFLGRYPGCGVRLQEIHFSDPFAALRTGQVDVALLWRPVREADLAEGPVLFTEGRVLAVSAAHHLAGRSEVSLEDLGDCVTIDLGTLPSGWIEAMVPSRTPSGRPIPRGPHAATLHEILTSVAADAFVTPLNQHARHYYSHPGVVLVPIHDASATEWALVWRANDTSALLRAFVETAATVGSRSLDLP
ncbi:LysR family transcriptional regulator [Hamadaea sp. NPDC050747]|uniref:LysR family transcriptional regulator n=1 Tax=Hamadaea sp. NPDC050747 TaxID=3155789 RepID=UPI0033F90027